MSRLKASSPSESCVATGRSGVSRTTVERESSPELVQTGGNSGCSSARYRDEVRLAGAPTLPPKSLASYIHFFFAGLLKQGQTGGIVPSQKFLVEKMLSPIPQDFSGLVVELGAGSGALTLRLARRCPLARILACEINPVLASDTRMNLARAGLDGRVQVVAEPAEKVLGDLQRNQTGVDFVVSGIPLGTLDRERALALIRCVHRTLTPGGMYIQFQHSLLDRKKIESCFNGLRTVQAFLNFPPAVVYFARK